jgi:hypothetical protein
MEAGKEKNEEKERDEKMRKKERDAEKMKRKWMRTIFFQWRKRMGKGMRIIWRRKNEAK